MKKNMGAVDCILRTIAAVVIAVMLIAGVFKGALAIVLGVLAAVFLLTSAVAFCPIYVPMKISTKKGDKSTGGTPAGV